MGYEWAGIYFRDARFAERGVFRSASQATGREKSVENFFYEETHFYVDNLRERIHPYDTIVCAGTCMANPFSALLDQIRGALSKKPGGTSVLGIDISSSAIKIVQVRKERGRAILETYGEILLGPYAGLAPGQAVNLPADKLKEALTDLIKGANITAQRAAIAIPLRSSLIISIDLPAMGEKQLNEMIPIEARKYIPVPISEVMLDWWVIPKREIPDERTEAPATPAVPVVDKVEVLMVAIHNGTLAQYRDAALQVGFSPEAFEIESFSSIRSVFGRDMLPTMILDMGASSTKITIVDFGIIRVSHVIAKGAQDITTALAASLGVGFEEAEHIKRESGIMGQTGDKNISSVASPVIEYIFFEASKVLTSYQKKYKRAVSKTILIGGGALLKGLEEVAGRSFEVPVVFGDPFSKVEAPAFLENVLVGAGPEFAVAIGLALRELQEG